MPGYIAAQELPLNEELNIDKPHPSERRHTPSTHLDRDLPAPWQFSLNDWKDVLWRVARELRDDHLSIVAAGIAFFMVLAVLSLLTVLVSFYGLVADPQLVERQLGLIAEVVPAPALGLLRTQLHALIAQPGEVLGVGFLVGIIGALWGVSNGAVSLIRGVNIAYDEDETRNQLTLRWLALQLTAIIVAFGLVGIVVVALFPLMLHPFGLAADDALIARLARWPVMIAAALAGLSWVYRVAPDRSKPKWRWVTVGSVVSTALWLLGSALLSLYVETAAYAQTYGSLAGIVIFMLWLYLSSLTVLLGAELNAELEHQTIDDSTIGPDRPMGQRGAVMADTVGESRPRGERRLARSAEHDEPTSASSDSEATRDADASALG